jgi:DNA-binding HxlR family transcriptional regulator
MSEYGQFCPVAKAAELLDQRWTLLVLRELMSGSERFNDIRRGVPKMSPTLLSRRLRELSRAGVVVRGDDGHYRLTEAGQELRPTVEALGQWGIRWISELGDADLDPHLLVWDMHRRIALSQLPTGRTVLHLEFPDVTPASARNWWLLMTRDGVDVCDVDPGFETTVSVRCPLVTLVRVWRGDLSWTSAQLSGDLTVSGAARARQALPGWFQLSVFAPTARPA